LEDFVKIIFEKDPTLALPNSGEGTKSPAFLILKRGIFTSLPHCWGRVGDGVFSA